MRELRIAADVEKLHEVVGFVTGQLEEKDCPMKTRMQIHLAVEEIFVNIASYAYAPEAGEAVIRMEITQENGGERTVGLTFMDSGKPFDPLAKEDPDMKLAADERKIGGLGIFMTKKSMDEVRYEYRDGMNVLYLKKKL